MNQNKRIADLEAKQEWLLDVVAGLLGDAKPQGTNFALLALAHGFTGEDRDGLHDFYRWVTTEAKGDMTPDRIAAEFAARVPKRADMLDRIVRAHLADRSHRSLVKLVLGVDFEEGGEGEQHDGE